MWTASREAWTETATVVVHRRKFARGTVLAGRFEVDRVLGEGGMGRVFAAYDRRRRDTVALKVLGSPAVEAISRIKGEFRAASEIVHPNLVRLYELFSDDKDWFFTMELALGTQLPVVLAAYEGDRYELVRRVFGQLAVAIFELHRHGTLHGDIKTSNFLVAPGSWHVTLLDFGLSGPAIVGSAPPAEGTPAYMAPELLMGQP
jgi:serine/threonine-protein kinase